MSDGIATPPDDAAPRDRPAEGSTIQLGVEPEEVHLFDAQTGLAIRRG